MLFSYVLSWVQSCVTFSVLRPYRHEQGCFFKYISVYIEVAFLTLMITTIEKKCALHSVKDLYKLKKPYEKCGKTYRTGFYLDACLESFVGDSLEDGLTRVKESLS